MLKISGQKEGGQELVGGLDCTVHRNFFGSQVRLLCLLPRFQILAIHHLCQSIFTLLKSE